MVCWDTILVRGFILRDASRFTMLLRMRSEILVAKSRAAASRTMRPLMLPRMNQMEKNA